MRFRLLLYRRVTAALVAGVVLIGLVAIAPVWAVALLATVGIAVCIWFLLLFGPAEPVYGQRGGGD
jgi:hypothetical protein